MKIVLSILFCLFTIVGECQPRWTGKMYVDDVKVSVEDNVFDKLGFKGIGNNIRLYQKHQFDNDTILVIKEISLNNYKLNKVDTIQWNNGNMNCAEFLALENADIILDYRRLFVFDRQEKRSRIYEIDTIKFNEIAKINDSLICLYHIYKYHPADGFSGLNMAIFNLKQGKIVATKKFDFPGVGLSMMISTWVYATEHNIYVITPMTGLLYKFNKNLELAESTKVPIRWNNEIANTKYQDSLDSIIYAENKKIREQINAHKTPSRSYVYSAEFDYNLIEEVRTKYEYIESLAPYNDSIILIVFYRAGYAYDKRDVLFYNIERNKIVREIKEWSCAINENEPKRFEDFFPVNLIMTGGFAPYFYSNKIVYPSFLKPNLYDANRLDSLLRIMVQDNRKNKTTWSFLEYTLN